MRRTLCGPPSSKSESPKLSPCWRSDAKAICAAKSGSCPPPLWVALVQSRRKLARPGSVMRELGRSPYLTVNAADVIVLGDSPRHVRATSTRSRKVPESNTAMLPVIESCGRTRSGSQGQMSKQAPLA